MPLKLQHLLVCGLTILLASCAIGSRKNVAKIPSTKFLPMPLTYAGQPFDAEWRERKHTPIQGNIYVKVESVILEGLLLQADEKLKKDAQELADRFTMRLMEELSKLEHRGVYLMEDKAPPGEHLLTLQCALLDLHDSNAVLNAAGTVVGMAIPVPGSSFVTGAAISGATKAGAKHFDKGHITFGARVLYDGRLVTQFAEYAVAPVTVAGNLNDYSHYGNHRHIIDAWAKAFAKDIDMHAEGRRPKGYRNYTLFNFYTQNAAPSTKRIRLHKAAEMTSPT